MYRAGDNVVTEIILLELLTDVVEVKSYRFDSIELDLLEGHLDKLVLHSWKGC